MIVMPPRKYVSITRSLSIVFNLCSNESNATFFLKYSLYSKLNLESPSGLQEHNLTTDTR